jgi:molecular chaperone GrpE
VNEPTSSRHDDSTQRRATHSEKHPHGPSVDLRSGDPSPSGANPDADAEVGANDGGDGAAAGHAAPGAGAAGETDGDDPAGDTDAAPGVDLESLADADPRTKAELIGAVLDLEADRDEYLDDLRRARAEFENYRRRVTREAAAQRRAGTAEAVAALLEVLDDLDRTLDAAEETSDEGLKKGVELVASKLIQALTSLGVERVDAVGEPFDPNVHEAVQQLPADEPTEVPVVAQVLRPGYRLEERVLRAAMVVVQG